MANLLAAVGRAGLADKMFKAMSFKREQEAAGMRTAMDEERLEKMRNENAVAAEDQKFKNQRIDLDSQLNMFPGGKDSPHGQHFYNWLKENNEIDPETGTFSMRAKLNYKKYLESDIGGIETRNKQHLMNVRQKISQIDKQIADPGNKGNRKELEEKRKRLEIERDLAISHLQPLAETAKREAEHKQKLELERVEADERAKAAKIKADKDAEQKRLDRENRLKVVRIRTSGNKVPKPGEALKTVASLMKSKATFDKTGKMDVLIASMFPELSKQKGKISKGDKKQVRKAYDDAIAYYKKFTPKDGKRQKAIAELEKQKKPTTEANIEFIMSHMK